MATVIKFCVLLCKYPSETLQMPEAVYGNAEIKKTQVYKCHKWFCHGRTSVDDPHRRQPPTSTMMKTSSVNAILCKVTNEGVFRRTSVHNKAFLVLDLSTIKSSTKKYFVAYGGSSNI
jgi:hypothetical protein